MVGASPENLGSVDLETIELTVMDDIGLSESPQVGVAHSGKDNSSSSDGEGDDSSGSEEERYSNNSYTYMYMVYILEQLRPLLRDM